MARWSKVQLICSRPFRLGDDAFWASFNLMQHSFSGRLGGWMLVLVAALFHYRFWCRYLCPFGAFLVLTNKIALLRRFEHCDLAHL